MTIAELIDQLQTIQAEHGNLEVLMLDTNEGTISDCEQPKLRVAEEEEFPSSWNMPAGLKFVQFRSG